MEQPNFRLDDKTAVITGATRGIGRGVAAMLAAADMVTGHVLMVDGGWTAQ